MLYNEIKKSYINEGINQTLYYYRDIDQKEIDMVLLRNATLSLIEIKVGQTFKFSITNSFGKLSDTKYIKGKNGIICTASQISIFPNGTFTIPFNSI